MSNEREEAARKFAEARGLIVQEDKGGLFLYNPTGEDIGYVPEPNAPIFAHLEFVGRVAEALGDEWLLTVQQDSNQCGNMPLAKHLRR